MSGYTIAEIFVWLLLAAILGFILGWLVRKQRCESEHGAEGRTSQQAPAKAVALSGASRVESAESAPADTAPAGKKTSKATAKKAPAKKSPAEKASVKKASVKKASVTKKAPVAKASATKTPATKTPATKAAVAKKTPAKKTPAKKTPAKKAAVAKKAPAKKAVTPGRFPGSAKPLSGGRAPSADYTIKGNEDSMIFHTPDSPSYGQTIAETWFKTEAAAVAAGFRKPLNA